MILFLYGAGQTYVDVTTDVLTKCLHGELIQIPAGDTGSALFPDPLPGIAKGILVIRQNGDKWSGQAYGPHDKILIVLRDDELPGGYVRGHTKNGGYSKRIKPPPPGLTPDEVIPFFHSQLQFTGGSLNAEWVEQHNTVEFLSPDAKVLELGSGCGRNTMMISCILNDESNLVTLECNPSSVEILRKNRVDNNFQFHIEAAALSYRKLMYNPSLALTIPGDELQEGYQWINTITFEEITTKYGIDFDTLIADCEGALYYILEDNENLLANIGTVILESDYSLAEHKWAVESVFRRYGLEKVKSWRMEPQTADLPKECMDSFWEVWKR